MKKLIYTAVLAAAALMLCSCTSDENRRFVTPYDDNIESTVVLAPVSKDESTAYDISEITLPLPDETEEPVTSEEEPQTSEDEEEVPPAWSEGLDDFYYYEYAAYRLSWAEREFTTQSLFVGDSICRGFREYHMVPLDRVYARGSIAARNFFDFSLYRNENEEEYTQALAETEPKYVFLSMGMNDINLTNEETYCENYRKIIDITLDNSEAEVYVAAITPIDCEFSTNYRIDCFNISMEKFIADNYSERVHYVDFAKHLKDSGGNLKECFNGGDGIHLSPYAYYVALWEMNRTMKADGVL